MVLNSGPVIHSENIEGTLINFSNGGLLISTRDGEWAGLISKETLFSGVSGVKELKPFMDVEITYYLDRKVPLIQILKTLPFYYSLPENEMFIKLPLNDVLPVDCRDEKEYRMYHIPGAIWFSPDYFDKPEKILKEKEKIIVFYGNSRQDLRPFLALSHFLKKGIQAKVYPEGVLGWNQNEGIFESEDDLTLFPEDTCFLNIGSKGNFEIEKFLEEEGLNWANFSNPQGMPYIVLMGEKNQEKSLYQIAEKIVKWRYQQEPLLDKPVIIWKGKTEKNYSLNLKKGCFKKEKDSISKEEFLNFLNSPQKEYLLVDLRFPPSNQREGILSIPLESLSEKIKELPKEKTLILFCSKGTRAKIAYKILKKLNFDVKYLSEEIDF
ncbi:MAG: rhodanese-like domain-containing protein [Thermoanaerobaculia bacterium]